MKLFVYYCHSKLLQQHGSLDACNYADLTNYVVISSLKMLKSQETK